MQNAVTSSMADKMLIGLQTRDCIRTHRQKRSSNGPGGGWGLTGARLGVFHCQPLPVPVGGG